jgi:hypothetical protein
MALRVEIKPDMTGQNLVLVVGNMRKMMAPFEFDKMKKIAKSGDLSDAATRLFGYFRKERTDIIQEAMLEEPKRKKLISEALVTIIRNHF